MLSRETKDLSKEQLLRPLPGPQKLGPGQVGVRVHDKDGLLGIPGQGRANRRQPQERVGTTAMSPTWGQAKSNFTTRGNNDCQEKVTGGGGDY